MMHAKLELEKIALFFQVRKSKNGQSLLLLSWSEHSNNSVSHKFRWRFDYCSVNINQSLDDFIKFRQTNFFMGHFSSTKLHQKFNLITLL